MIHFFIGTKAQLIKMAPIIISLQKKSIPFRYIDSGQHANITRSLRQLFNLPDPDFSLRDNQKDISSIKQAISWYIHLWFSTYTNRAFLREQVFPGGGTCLIHGDTLSTLLGLQMARAAGLKVAHIEAGLRSHRLFDPFPEEFIRIFCMRRSDLLFAPSDTAYANLEKMKVDGEIFNIKGNTVLDTLRIIGTHSLSTPLPNKPFALVTCHRLETITSRKRLGQVVDLINRVAKDLNVVFVMHKPTKNYLDRFNIFRKLGPRVHCQNMLDYDQFIPLLMQSSLVLTDGGSIQEECAALSKPCLILRNVTERADGLGNNARLWGFDQDMTEKLLSELSNYCQTNIVADNSPSEKVINTLISKGFL